LKFHDRLNIFDFNVFNIILRQSSAAPLASEIPTTSLIFKPGFIHIRNHYKKVFILNLEN